MGPEVILGVAACHVTPLYQPASRIRYGHFFGGRDLYGRQSSRLYSFVGVEAESWKRVYPAGIRPTRRTGNTLAYDQDFGRIVSSFGMDGTGMLEDTWILDLPTSTWTCFYGSGPTCTHAAPNQLYAGPGKICLLYTSPSPRDRG